MKITKKIFALFLLILLVLPFVCQADSDPEPASAQPTKMSEAVAGLAELVGLDTGAGEEATLQQRIGQIIKALLFFLGTLFFILTIYAGIVWMIARGNEEKVTEAKNTLIGSVIGLAIVIGAYAISSAILRILLSAETASTK